ncbi:MAG: tol-pal system protein YbgF [Alphaproteobacteria bacterium]|nr:tol-pal system protein YbgF [Alphaproteobacteria bacterium]
MNRNSLMFFCGVVACFSFSARANDSFLREEVNKLKEDIVIMQRKLYHEKNDTTMPDASVSNFQIKLGDYDQLMRDINGKVENIEYRLTLLEKKLEGFDKDIELRFEQFKKHLSTGDKYVSKPVEKKVEKAPTGTSPIELYNNARILLDSNKYSEAENKFSQFLATFPKDNLAGNAQYWLGEVYYKQQDFAKAAIAFYDGYNNYPGGAKAPDCLLKLGLSMKALGKKDEACKTFIEIPLSYEKANPGISERAKKEAKELGCK